jgi:hypothetical protein
MSLTLQKRAQLADKVLAVLAGMDTTDAHSVLEMARSEVWAIENAASRDAVVEKPAKA